MGNDPWTDPATGAPLAGPCVPPPSASFQQDEALLDAARAAGWVPLAEVLDAVWDIDAIQRWATTRVPLGGFIGHQQIHDYLADRFGAKEAGRWVNYPSSSTW